MVGKSICLRMKFDKTKITNHYQYVKQKYSNEPFDKIFRPDVYVGSFGGIRICPGK